MLFPHLVNLFLHIISTPGKRKNLGKGREQGNLVKLG
jgi:hypothetical protein